MEAQWGLDKPFFAQYWDWFSGVLHGDFGRSIITNEEFDDTLVEVSLVSRRHIWTYGHVGVPGRSAGYLDAPDDAYRLPGGITTGPSSPWPTISSPVLV